MIIIGDEKLSYENGESSSEGECNIIEVSHKRQRIAETYLMPSNQELSDTLQRIRAL